MNKATELFSTQILALYDELMKLEDKREFLEVMIDLQDCKKELAAVIGAVEQEIIKRTEQGEVLSLNGWNATHTNKSARKDWNHDKLTQTILDRLRMTSMDDDGVINLTPEDVAAKLLTYAGIQYWRVKPLQDELGINVDLFCKKEEGDETISIKKER